MLYIDYTILWLYNILKFLIRLCLMTFTTITNNNSSKCKDFVKNTRVQFPRQTTPMQGWMIVAKLPARLGGTLAKCLLQQIQLWLCINYASWTVHLQEIYCRRSWLVVVYILNSTKPLYLEVLLIMVANHQT